MQMQNTYWLEKVLKMISLYVDAQKCTPTLIYETAGRFFVHHSVFRDKIDLLEPEFYI